ncbi:hypothetical protein DFH08DRAFT_1080273 [Mycena albidolilacea]|uniref:Uncharacterized protein n=1 Tax=Mycena albidolilacea TaxID=1033008 RepID=A0AAD7ESJ9_9AGAR|nr:hypothetical protein DFH08DRAFT_1080273 [Mycena albidolilacea]
MPVVRPPKRECAQPPPTRTSLAERTRATASAVELEQGVAIPTILVPARPHLLPQPQKTCHHPAELSFIDSPSGTPAPNHTSAWTDSNVFGFLLHTAISIPPRPASTRGASPFVFVLCRGGTEVALPRKYRLPLLWMQKFMWQSVPLVQPLVSWNHGKWDVLHIARLCYTLICAACEAGEEGDMTDSLRYPTVDRALLRYWHRWLVSRDGFVEDVLAFDWSAWVLKDHKGFFLTKEEARNGISAEEFVRLTGLEHLPVPPQATISSSFSRSPTPENPPGDSIPLNTLVSGMSHSSGWHYVGVSNQAPPLPEAKSLSKSEKAALMPEFTLFRSSEKQREQVSVSDKRQEQRERASRSQDRPSDDAPAWDVGMGNGPGAALLHVPVTAIGAVRATKFRPAPAQTARKKTVAWEDEDYQEDAHPATRYAENREQEAQPETEVNMEIEEDSDLDDDDDDDDDSLELLYPEQSSAEKGKVRSPHPSRAARRARHGHGRRFDGCTTGTARHPTPFRYRPVGKPPEPLTERVGYPSYGTRRTGATGTACSPTPERPLAVAFPDARIPSEAPPATKPLAQLQFLLAIDLPASPPRRNGQRSTPTRKTPAPGAFHGILDELVDEVVALREVVRGDGAQAQEKKRLGLEQRVKGLQKDGVGTRWDTYRTSGHPYLARGSPHRRSSSVQSNAAAPLPRHPLQHLIDGDDANAYGRAQMDVDSQTGGPNVENLPPRSRKFSCAVRTTRI